MDPDLRDRLDSLLALATKAERQEAADYLHNLAYHTQVFSGKFPLTSPGGCRCWGEGFRAGKKASA